MISIPSTTLTVFNLIVKILNQEGYSEPACIHILPTNNYSATCDQFFHLKHPAILRFAQQMKTGHAAVLTELTGNEAAVTTVGWFYKYALNRFCIGILEANKQATINQRNHLERCLA